MKDKFQLEYELFLQSLSNQSFTSIRLNPQKINFEKAHLHLADKIAWAKEAYYLRERPSFTFDPYFHAGCYYVQEASSMFLEYVFRQIPLSTSGLKILDLCASPGGKSTHLLSLISDKDLLVSNEVVPVRLSMLKENLAKWGCDNVVITRSYAEQWALVKNFFDVILIDAPCSGEGLFRKDKEAVSEWSEKNVQNCAIRQASILENIQHCLKPGGHLIYSTCTFEGEENIQQINSLCSQGSFHTCSFPIPETFSDQITIVQKKDVTGYAFYPHKTRGEGFFISLLQKEKSDWMFSPTKKTKKSVSVNHSILEPFLQQKDWLFLEEKEFQYAIHLSHLEALQTLQTQVSVTSFGVKMGEIKGKDFIPAPELALSNELNEAVEKVELTFEEAIKYLQTECFNKSLEPGWKVACYNGFALGWIKSMGNRWNNYYPKEWKIRKKTNA